jgi:hypothetical protein
MPTEQHQLIDRRAPRPARLQRLRVQTLTIVLAGITAGDYLAWVRDPEPPALERDLRRIATKADPLGERIDLQLVWDREPPSAEAALRAAGFPLAPADAAVETSSAAGPGR